MAQVMANRHDDMNAALAAAGAGNQAQLCGAQGNDWDVVEPHDPDIIEKGIFAVDEQNKKGCTKLDFVSVTSAQRKKGAGVHYRLTISAKDGTKSDLYDAGVFHSFNGTKTLEYFVRVN